MDEASEENSTKKRRLALLSELSLALEGKGVNEAIPSRPVEQIRSDLESLGMDPGEQLLAVVDFNDQLDEALSQVTKEEKVKRLRRN